MALPETSSGITIITPFDIYGLWEVIKIFEDENQVSYPWLNLRMKYSFLEDMIYLYLRGDQTTHGKWELSERIQAGQIQYSLILNDQNEYFIIEFSDDELLLTDQRHHYLLVRRL